VPIPLSSFISELLLVLGHRHLWKGGIEHNDISVSNLMYDKRNNNAGILNDFDLALVDGEPRPSGTERTGTMPFMALELLTEDAWAGKVERLYRHDCESFVWVLLWICSRYDNGAEIDNPPFDDFITSNFLQCSRYKRTCEETILKLAPRKSYENDWPAAIELVYHVVSQQYASRTGKFASAPRIEPTNDEKVRDYQGRLKDAGFNADLRNGCCVFNHT
jgi:hypothetical protein